MKTVTLVRTFADSRVTLGCLYVDRDPVCFTVELPWKGNRPNESCVPLGVHTLVRTTTGKTMPQEYAGETYEVSGVPLRTLVKFHVANAPDELLGCIGPNMGVDCLHARGTNSTEATRRFMRAMGGVDRAVLLIKEADYLVQ